MKNLVGPLLRAGLAALLLVSVVASGRLSGDRAGALASGLPQSALLCSANAVVDPDGNAVVPVHCDACLLLAALTPTPPAATRAVPAVLAVLVPGGHRVSEPAVRVVYAARAPPIGV